MNGNRHAKIIKAMGRIAEMSVYTDEGYANRREYLESLAEEYELDIDTVLMVAAMLGPSEDFDGLVTTLEDMSYEMEG